MAITLLFEVVMARTQWRWSSSGNDPHGRGDRFLSNDGTLLPHYTGHIPEREKSSIQNKFRHYRPLYQRRYKTSSNTPSTHYLSWVPGRICFSETCKTISRGTDTKRKLD